MNLPKQGALKGIRVLDLGRFLAGPSAAQMLGDFGAEVIKVERPGFGDDQRRNGVCFLKNADGSNSRESSFYLTANRNKRDLTIELSKPAGQDLVRKLAAKADVLIENFKTGSLVRYGLDYESIRKIHPGIVYCSVTGYGQDGPYAARAGYDPIFQAQSGLMSITGYPDSEPGGGPMKVGTNLIDLMAGMNAAFGIMVALHERANNGTGEGQAIDIALLDTAMVGMSGVLLPYFMDGVLPERVGNGGTSGGPNGVLHCADSDIMISTGNEEHFKRICEVLDAPEMATDPRFETMTVRGPNRHALFDAMNARARNRKAIELVDALAAAGVPAGAVNNVEQAMADPQVKARGIEFTLPHPLKPDLRLIASPVRLSRTPPSYDRPPPLIGEHTDEVLHDWLDMDDDAIAALRRDGVI
jgi:crotonobetainyl-CoA:carnitine CoA-transferase CaiB-like acyl-CoA transferase